LQLPAGFFLLLDQFGLGGLLTLLQLELRFEDSLETVGRRHLADRFQLPDRDLERVGERGSLGLLGQSHNAKGRDGRYRQAQKDHQSDGQLLGIHAHLALTPDRTDLLADMFSSLVTKLRVFSGDTDFLNDTM